MKQQRFYITKKEQSWSNVIALILIIVSQTISLRFRKVQIDEVIMILHLKKQPEI